MVNPTLLRKCVATKSRLVSTDDRTPALHEISPQQTNSSCKLCLETVQTLPQSNFTALQSVHRQMSADVAKDILTNLSQAHNHPHDADSSTHIPRKDDTMPNELDLNVECSDPYGLLDVDEN